MALGTPRFPFTKSSSRKNLETLMVPLDRVRIQETYSIQKKIVGVNSHHSPVKDLESSWHNRSHSNWNSLQNVPFIIFICRLCMLGCSLNSFPTQFSFENTPRSITVCPWHVTFPKGKDRLPTTIFQGRHVKLQGVIPKVQRFKSSKSIRSYLWWSYSPSQNRATKTQLPNSHRKITMPPNKIPHTKIDT